jgi:hypothetical protein
MGELTGEGREGEGEGSCGRDWGVPGGIVGGGGARPGLLHAISLSVMLVVREGRKQEGGRRREEREKKRRREGKKKRKKWE